MVIALQVGLKPDRRGFDVWIDDAGRARDAAGRFAKSVDGLDRQMGVTGRSAVDLTSKFQRLIAVLGGVAIARQALRTVVDIEQALVGVGKTTDITGLELEALGDQFIALSTQIPVAAAELLSLGQAAGQLGVTGADNILVFSETIARLGSASDLAGEQAALSLARILNVTGEAVGSVDTLASVIVRLGNEFAATESEIAAAATRVAGAGAIYDITSAQATALATALRATGTEAEVSGSVIARAFEEINAALRDGGRELEALERITGQTATRLRQAFGEDSVGVFQTFIQGLSQIRQAGGDVSEALGELNLTGVRLTPNLGKLAANVDLLNRALVTAEDELALTNALLRESGASFDTLGSELQLLRNALVAVTLELGESSGGLREVISVTRGAILELAGLGDRFDGNRQVAQALARSLEVLGGTAGFLLVARSATIATTAVRTFTASLLTNPLTALLGALGLAAGAAFAFREEIADLRIEGARLGDILGVTFETVADVIRELAPLLRTEILPLLQELGTVAREAFGILSDVRDDFLDALGTDWEEVWVAAFLVVRSQVNGALAAFDTLLFVVDRTLDGVRAATDTLARINPVNPLGSIIANRGAIRANLNELAKLTDDFSAELVAEAADNFSRNYLEGVESGISRLGEVLGNVSIRAARREGERAGAEFAARFQDQIGAVANIATLGIIATGQTPQTPAEQDVVAAGGAGFGRTPGLGAGGGDADAEFAERRRRNAASIREFGDPLREQILLLEAELSVRQTTNENIQREIELRQLTAAALASGNLGLLAEVEALRQLQEELDGVIAAQAERDKMERERQQEEARRSQERAGRLAQFGDQAAGEVTDVFRTVTEEGFSDLENLGRAALRNVLRSFREAFILGPFQQALSGGIQGGLGRLPGFGAARGVALGSSGRVQRLQLGGFPTGVIRDPTAFATDSGVGFASEFGQPEVGFAGSNGRGAVAPLVETSRGLGVNVAGVGGRNTTVNMGSIVINAPRGGRDLNRSVSQFRRNVRRAIREEV